MPELDGFAVASLLKADPHTSRIPIIIITTHTGRGTRVVGLHTGAEDYLTKPVDAAELSLKTRNLLRLDRQLCGLLGPDGWLGQQAQTPVESCGASTCLDCEESFSRRYTDRITIASTDRNSLCQFCIDSNQSSALAR